MRQLIIAINLSLICATEIAATEVTLSPESSLRVVNPEDKGDVRVLYKFSLPSDAGNSDIVRAFLTVPTQGSQEVLLMVTPLDQSWSTSDTWQTLASRLVASPGYGSSDTRSVIGASSIHDGQDRGFEVHVSEAVRSWALGRMNHGLCVKRHHPRTDDLSRALVTAMAMPTLTIIYIPSN